MPQQSEPIACPGLFYATSAQDGIISRMRTPGGLLTRQQGRAVAQCAEQCGDGYIQITNRANLQIRAVYTTPPPYVLTTLQALGLAAPRASIDHRRTIMASPTAGIDAQALIDTCELVKALDDSIIQHEAFAGLPAKFSVGFDGGEVESHGTGHTMGGSKSLAAWHTVRCVTISHREATHWPRQSVRKGGHGGSAAHV